MYYVIRAILRFLAFFIFNIKTVNRPSEDPEGGLMVCPNHQSMLDIVVMIITYPGRLIFVGKKELASNPFAFLFRWVGTIFIDRDKVSMETIRTIIKHLEAGDTLCIFPEGTRVHEVDPKNMKEGVGLFIQRTHCPVLPVHIEADYRFRGKIVVEYKDIEVFEELKAMPRRDQRPYLSQQIFNAIYDTDYSIEDF